MAPGAKIIIIWCSSTSQHLSGYSFEHCSSMLFRDSNGYQKWGLHSPFRGHHRGLKWYRRIPWIGIPIGVHMNSCCFEECSANCQAVTMTHVSVNTSHQVLVLLNRLTRMMCLLHLTSYKYAVHLANCQHLQLKWLQRQNVLQLSIYLRNFLILHRQQLNHSLQHTRLIQLLTVSRNTFIECISVSFVYTIYFGLMGEGTSYPILTKLCKWAGMANVITDIKFGDGCFSGFDAAWMVNLPFPIDFRMALTTGLCYRVACDTKATM